MAEKAKVGTEKTDKTKAGNLPEPNEMQSQQPAKKTGRIFKIILIIFVLLIIAATGFALGIYLKLIDMQGMADNWKLQDYPVIGRYFSEPKTNFEPVELDQQNPVVPQSNIVSPPLVPPLEAMVEKPKIDDAELQKQAKLKQLEEAKRISKLARLYGNMKPDEAVAILNQMDDGTVLVIMSKMEDEQVAKIMALFEPRRAAILSQSMLRGRSSN